MFLPILPQYTYAASPLSSSAPLLTLTISLPIQGMKVYAVTFVASSLSGIVLMCCLLAICQIYGNVQEFWRELDEEMSTIRVSNTPHTLPITNKST